MSPYTLQYAQHAPETWHTLGEIQRTGWVMRGVRDPETVQEHTLALIRLVDTLPGLASYHETNLRAMLEVHDWPEAIVGDEVILESDERIKAARKQAKHQRERQAMEEICAPLGTIGSEVYTLWEQYERGDDPVAQIAKQIDKYQSIERALGYELEQQIPGLFKEFRDYLLPILTDPAMLAALRAKEERARSAGVVF